MTAGPIKNAFILPGITGPTGLFEIVNILATGPTGSGLTGRHKTYNQLTGPAGATGPTGTFKTFCYAGAGGLVGKRTIIVPGYAAAVGAVTTFDPSSLGASVILSNGNLTATRDVGTTDTGAKGLTSTMKLTGKGYYEMTWLNGAGTDTGMGACTAVGTYANLGASGEGGAMCFISGNLWVGVASGQSLGPIATNDIVAVAIDPANALIWFRNVTKAGNWNGSPTANPATGLGGLTMINHSLAVGPACILSTTGASFSLNAGQTAFAGAVPSGFTAWG